MVYEIEPLDINALLSPVSSATAALVRLDERLARSPVREGWIERQHFADAAAALWLEGELVHIEDLVLHDAHMDIRTPTHELTRAHAVLRSRRQIAGHKPEWALSPNGIRQLTRRGDVVSEQPVINASPAEPLGEAPDELSKALAAMDAVLERTAKVLDGNAPVDRSRAQHDRPELIYDLDWDEEARLTEWQDVLAATRSLPVVLRGAILADAWAEIEVLQHGAWLGPLLVAALLRQDGVSAHHLPSWHLGAKQIPRERRRSRDRTERLIALVDVVQQAATLGLKEHDRLVLARSQMERRLGDKRTNSRLPELIDFALSRPLISSSMVQQSLKISKQGSLNLIGELGMREITGRGRFRAWGVL